MNECSILKMIRQITIRLCERVVRGRGWVGPIENEAACCCRAISEVNVVYLDLDRGCRFTREGDFLITCGKDSNVNLWWADNGERAGTFNGHNGAVWTTDTTCTAVIHAILIAASLYLVNCINNILFVQTIRLC